MAAFRTAFLILTTILFAEFATADQFIVQLASTGPAARDVKRLDITTLSQTLSVPVSKRLPLDNSVVADLNAADIKRLKSGGVAVGIERDQKMTVSRVPNDPFVNQSFQYGLTGTFGVGAAQAWEVTTGSRDVVVAVIDTGIDLDHPDLRSNIWTNPGELPANGIDDDGNGFTDDLHGWNFSDGNANPDDDNEHGTHVSGTIGAVGDNDLGGSGVAWAVSILPLKALDANGSGFISSIAEAADYANQLVDSGVKIRVMNLSLGGGNSAALFRALERCRQRGILIVAAAGNEANDNDAFPAYPASYPLDNVIAVAATSDRGAVASFSNFGTTSVHVAAPGVNILSTLPSRIASDGFGILSGTSMATPHVAGVAALVASVNPLLTASQIREVLFSTVVKLSSLQGAVSTGGLVDAASAVRTAAGLSGAYRVVGHVLKEKRKGLKDAKVTLSSPSTGTQAVERTTSDGSFSFGAVPPGEYVLEVKRKGFRFKPARYGLSVSGNVAKDFTGKAHVETTRR